MKRKWGLLFVLATILFGCEELSQTYHLKDLGNVDLFQQYMVEKNLIISEFLKGSDNKTDYYENYTFIFTMTGGISSVFNNDTVNGSWTISTEDTISKMVINFGEAGDPLVDLNEDWIVLSQSESKIELKDMNSEGGLEYLTFIEL